MNRPAILRIILRWIAMLLPLLCAGVWIGSAFAPPMYPWSTPMDYTVGGWQLMADGRSLVLWHHEVGSQLPPTIQREFLGFSTARSGWGDIHGQLGSSLAYAVSFITLQVLTTLPLLLLIVRRLIRRRPRPGHCPVCGYDLRATPDRCPECGTTVTALRRVSAP